ncbi:MAG: T9SS type A sorting domain-containing protein [Chitinophagales bacterium]
MRYCALIALISPLTLFSQSISPYIVSNAGGTMESNEVIMDFSIGELVIETFDNTEILTQGFHQDALAVAIPIVELDILTRIYPNPSADELLIELSRQRNGEISLYDIGGKLVMQDVLQEGQLLKKLDVSDLGAGSYILQIKSSTETSVYKIEKYN